MTILSCIQKIAPSDDARCLYRTLTSFSAAEENGAVVLVAAATLIARQAIAHPSSDIAALAEEFAELLREVHREFPRGRAVKLKLVGGRDVR